MQLKTTLYNCSPPASRSHAVTNIPVSFSAMSIEDAVYTEFNTAKRRKNATSDRLSLTGLWQMVIQVWETSSSWQIFQLHLSRLCLWSGSRFSVTMVFGPISYIWRRSKLLFLACNKTSAYQSASKMRNQTVSLEEIKILFSLRVTMATDVYKVA